MAAHLAQRISIHAPRVGSDPGAGTFLAGRRDFNPRSPCGERRACPEQQNVVHVISIHAPRVGSDRNGLACGLSDRNFNPRSPCGERPSFFSSSILFRIFQSTLPVWGATAKRGRLAGFLRISIHAPRVGSDGCWQCRQAGFGYFNPRSPCGERPRF